MRPSRLVLHRIVVSGKSGSLLEPVADETPGSRSMIERKCIRPAGSKLRCDRRLGVQRHIRVAFEVAMDVTAVPIKRRSDSHRILHMVTDCGVVIAISLTTGPPKLCPTSEKSASGSAPPLHRALASLQRRQEPVEKHRDSGFQCAPPIPAVDEPIDSVLVAPVDETRVRNEAPNMAKSTGPSATTICRDASMSPVMLRSSRPVLSTEQSSHATS